MQRFIVCNHGMGCHGRQILYDAAIIEHVLMIQCQKCGIIVR